MDRIIAEILDNQEWLQDTDGNEIRCISIENLESILSRYFGEKIRLDDPPNPKQLNLFDEVD